MPPILSGLPLFLKFLIKFLLDALKLLLVTLLPFVIVLQSHLNRLAQFNIFLDESKGHFEQFHIVGDEDEVILFESADVVGLLVEGARRKRDVGLRAGVEFAAVWSVPSSWQSSNFQAI